MPFLCICIFACVQREFYQTTLTFCKRTLHCRNVWYSNFLGWLPSTERIVLKASAEFSLPFELFFCSVHRISICLYLAKIHTTNMSPRGSKKGFENLPARPVCFHSSISAEIKALGQIRVICLLSNPRHWQVHRAHKALLK